MQNKGPSVFGPLQEEIVIIIIIIIKSIYIAQVRKGHKCAKWVKQGWSNIRRWGRDRRGKGKDPHQPQLKSPPTFQPWLRLWE